MSAEIKSFPLRGEWRASAGIKSFPLREEWHASAGIKSFPLRGEWRVSAGIKYFPFCESGTQVPGYKKLSPSGRVARERRERSSLGKTIDESLPTRRRKFKFRLELGGRWRRSRRMRGASRLEIRAD